MLKAIFFFGGGGGGGGPIYMPASSELALGETYSQLAIAQGLQI